mmetsp:Transcript_3749/g.9439  ORF Transcript_3749/g.9439 Transcript_3749/m.9439 type:complete len:217 (+) Transcript_3749:617-1267(+)
MRRRAAMRSRVGCCARRMRRCRIRSRRTPLRCPRPTASSSSFRMSSRQHAQRSRSRVQSSISRSRWCTRRTAASWSASNGAAPSSKRSAHVTVRSVLWRANWLRPRESLGRRSGHLRATSRSSRGLIRRLMTRRCRAGGRTARRWPSAPPCPPSRQPPPKSPTQWATRARHRNSLSTHRIRITCRAARRATPSRHTLHRPPLGRTHRRTTHRARAR